MDVFDLGKGSEMRMALKPPPRSADRSGDEAAAAASYDGRGGGEVE